MHSESTSLRSCYARLNMLSMFSRSCDIVDLRQFLISFILENNCSPEQFVTIRQRKMRGKISML